MLSVFDTTYQVSYSESYTGNVHGNNAIEGYPYCMSLFGAFELLMAQSHTSFVLAVGCIVAGMYCNKLWYFQNNLIFMVEICVVTMSPSRDICPFRSTTYKHYVIYGLDVDL